tara:strand:- start:3193 stop:4338 length:1146 start_codon:yes stop_codon:yes gene_type:complete
MRDNKPVVVFIINSLGLGGAERALNNILQATPQHEQFNIHLILLDREQEHRIMPEFVTVHRLDSRRSLIRSVYLLAQKLSALKPSLSVSLLVRSNVANVIVNRILHRRPAIICERMHLSSHLALQFSGLKLVLSKMIPRVVYPFASQALGVSTGVTNDLVQNFNMPKARTLTIFNPYDHKQICHDGKQTNEFALSRQYIVAVGRLTKSKNFGMLIKAYYAADCPYDLVILGDGDSQERNKLQALIDAKNLSEKVHLAGYANNPFSVMKNAVFYISASLNEGFPNAMLEAMVLGLPVVASNCESGPAEILANDDTLAIDAMYPAKYGILVPTLSIDSLTQAINAMSQTDTLEHYRQMSLQRSLDFEIHKIANQYWQNFRTFL